MKKCAESAQGKNQEENPPGVQETRPQSSAALTHCSYLGLSLSTDYWVLIR